MKQDVTEVIKHARLHLKAAITGLSGHSSGWREADEQVRIVDDLLEGLLLILHEDHAMRLALRELIHKYPLPQSVPGELTK